VLVVAVLSFSKYVVVRRPNATLPLLIAIMLCRHLGQVVPNLGSHCCCQLGVLKAAQSSLCLIVGTV
jgi:hypothetical protein